MITRHFGRSIARLSALYKSNRTASSDSSVLFSGFDSPIRSITLNRPAVLNALSMPMIDAIRTRLLAWDADPDVACVVMSGSGSKAFCAGGDVIAIANAVKSGDSRFSSEFFRREFTLIHLIGTLSKPHVAIIDGITMGGGVGLSVHGSFRVATERSVFAMPETAIGFVPDVGGTQFLSRLGSLGLALGLSGWRLRGPDVWLAGIATHYCHSTLLTTLNERLSSANANNNNNNDHFQAVARVLDEFHHRSLPKQHRYALDEHREDIDACFGRHAESVEHVVERLRERNSAWTRLQLERLARMSPTSMKVFFHQLKAEGVSTDLGQCLRMEYRLSQHLTRDSDFYEGVRALLIDKDGRPRWRPAALEQVTQERVQGYFQAFDKDVDELHLPEGRHEQPIFRAR